MKKKVADLQVALERLEASVKKIIQTRGYTSEVEKMKMLEELIREQLSNENLNHPNREVR